MHNLGFVKSCLLVANGHFRAAFEPAIPIPGFDLGVFSVTLYLSAYGVATQSINSPGIFLDLKTKYFIH